MKVVKRLKKKVRRTTYRKNGKCKRVEEKVTKKFIQESRASTSERRMRLNYSTCAAHQSPEEEDNRRKAAIRFGLLSPIQFFLGLILFIIAAIAFANHGDGKKYYIIVLLAGVIIMGQAALGMAIYILEVRWYGKYSTLMSYITSLLYVYAAGAMINSVLCLVGLIVIGINGICSGAGCISDTYAAGNTTRAAITLFFLVLSLATCVCNFVWLHFAQSEFGVSMLGQDWC